jgi:hypothetical protein
MKKLANLLLLPLAGMLLLAWGKTGHRTVGRIAAAHLSVKTQQSIQYLLGSQTLAQVSTWADEVRATPAYRHTGASHYINLPDGLDFNAFKQAVTGMQKDNAYSALLKYTAQLADTTLPKAQRAEALKWVVHLIGDLHQPMHVSHEEDKGGNDIQVRYQNRGTNLHTLWDSRLIETKVPNDSAMAVQLDNISARRIKNWQQDEVLQWIWESYTISSRLYHEVAAQDSTTLPKNYYARHIGTARGRLQKAGIRLAGYLNHIFEGR